MNISIIILIIVVCLLIFITIMASKLRRDKYFVLNFIKNNPEKASIKLIYNNRIICEQFASRIMPLASTVKIIVAIEYAMQSAQKEINPDETISIKELDLFYVENTDWNAHPDWLKSIESKIINGKISIREIAKGMINYSSNANTEWLTQKLGLKNINNRIQRLGITDHTEFYYIVSSLFVGKEKFPGLKGNPLENELKKLSIQEYIDLTNQIHTKLIKDSNYKSDIGDFGLNIQKIWSDKLPASSVKSYIELMQKLNSKAYFDTSTQQYLDEVMESVMENFGFKKTVKHSGMKGGSTSFILTQALYETDNKGNTLELVYFLNNLEPDEQMKIQKCIHHFEMSLLTNKKFRTEIEQEFSN